MPARVLRPTHRCQRPSFQRPVRKHQVPARVLRLIVLVLRRRWRRRRHSRLYCPKPLNARKGNLAFPKAVSFREGRMRAQMGFRCRTPSVHTRVMSFSSQSLRRLHSRCLSGSLDEFASRADRSAKTMCGQDHLPRHRVRQMRVSDQTCQVLLSRRMGKAQRAFLRNLVE